MLIHNCCEQLIDNIRIETKGHRVTNLLFIDDREAISALLFLKTLEYILVFNKRAIADNISIDARCLKIPDHEHATHNHLLECSLINHRHDI